MKTENLSPEMAEFYDRLAAVQDEIELGMNCTLEFWQDHGDEIANGRFYFQISCERPDAITGVMGTGRSGKAFLSQHMTSSELVQVAFGLYKGYWEHEAREMFKWRGRRVFGPHISTEALWEVARRVDVRSAKHVEDQPKPAEHEFGGLDGAPGLEDFTEVSEP